MKIVASRVLTQKAHIALQSLEMLDGDWTIMKGLGLIILAINVN